MRILIIDDDADEIELFQAARGDSADVHFYEADNFEAAWKQISKQLPDLIFLDVHLGPYSGIDCLKDLRSKPETKCIPVIMFSTSNSQPHIDACYETGADYFFVKPDTMSGISKLLSKVKEMKWTETQHHTRETFVLNC